jgi:hypothetical protein
MMLQRLRENLLGILLPGGGLDLVHDRLQAVDEAGKKMSWDYEAMLGLAETVARIKVARAAMVRLSR